MIFCGSISKSNPRHCRRAKMEIVVAFIYSYMIQAHVCVMGYQIICSLADFKENRLEPQSGASTLPSEHQRTFAFVRVLLCADGMLLLVNDMHTVS